jgi:WD40 repeat protein
MTFCLFFLDWKSVGLSWPYCLVLTSNFVSVKGDWTSLAVGQRDGGIAIWNLSSGGEVKPRHSQLLWGHPGQPVKHLKFHPGGDLLASVSSSSNQGKSIFHFYLNVLLYKTFFDDWYFKSTIVKSLFSGTKRFSFSLKTTPLSLSLKILLNKFLTLKCQ